MIAGPRWGMRSTPAMSKRAYGNSSGRVNSRTTSRGSKPASFGTPGGTSSQRIGQRGRRLLDDLSVPPGGETRRAARERHADERLPHHLVDLEHEVLAG